MARDLRRFLLAFTRYAVIAVDGGVVEDHLRSTLMKTDVVPRIFITEPDWPYTTRNTILSDPFYGDVVEFNELNDVLESSVMYWKAQRRIANQERTGLRDPETGIPLLV
jgi:hypothetical protein